MDILNQLLQGFATAATPINLLWALLGLALALAAYFGFAKALGVNIGAGLVEDLIERLLGG